jgi:type IV pilus assembly protein PilQ
MKGGASVFVAVRGQTKVMDFTLTGPERIVMDISPARLGQVPAYDRNVRGGITNIRFTQYEQNVVRVVLDLDRKRDYQIATDSNGIRLVLEADSSRFDEWNSASTAAYAPAAPAPMSFIDSLVQAQQAQRITVTYTNQDIKTVIARFAEFSGRTILTNDSVVKGSVSGVINNQPWDVALNHLLDVNGYAMTVDTASGIIKVDTYANIFARQQTERLMTQTVDVNYARPAQLAELLRGLLYRDCSSGQPGLQQTMQTQTGTAIGMPAVPPGCIVRGSVVADTLTGKLVITEVSSRMPDLLARVRTWTSARDR